MTKFWMTGLVGLIISCANVAYAWTLSPASKEIGAKGGSFTLTVSGDEYYDWSGGAAYANWITVTKTSAKTFTVTVAENNTSEVRGANVSINAFQGGAGASAQTWVDMHSCSITQVANVTGGEDTQISQDSIVAGVTPSTLSVGAEGTATNIEIQTIGAWTVENSLPWISVDRVSGTGPGSLVVTIAANEARQYRFGTFVVAGQAVHVTQNGVIEPCGVTSVTACQRYPYSGKVDIDYYIQGNIQQNAQDAGYLVSLEVSAEDLRTGTRYVAREISGDLTLSEGKHSIVWDMEKQGISFQSDQVVFSVSCKTSEALYCIVDLSSGAESTSYPIVYTNEIPGGSWSDEYKTSKLVLRRIEAGQFGAFSYYDTVLTTNTLTRPYYIGVFELTYGQCCLIRSETTPPLYLDDMDAPPHIDWDSVCRKYPMTISYNQLRGENLGAHWPLSADVDEGSVVAELRNRTGLMFDLPTCSQWVCAYRAGTNTEFYWGNAPRTSGQNALMDLYAWNWGNTRNGVSADPFGGVHGVGLKLPNAWGLYDMTGNVWEWNLDYCAGNIGWMLLTGSNVKQYYCGVDPVGPVKEWSYMERRCMAGGAIQNPVDMPKAGEVWGEVSSRVDWYKGARLVVNLKSDQIGMVSSGSMSEIVTIDTVNLMYAPVISVETGMGANFNCIICWESDWPIYYTMDGSEPTSESMLYDGKIIGSARGSKIIKTIAISPSGEKSEVATLEITAPNPPTISPASGTIISSSVSVNIASDNPNATIYYTTDGTEPTTDSPVYSRFKASKKMTVKAIAVVDGMAWSETAMVDYALGQCADPIIIPEDGTIFDNSNYQVSIAKNGDNGILRYTIDGSDPTETSPVYAGPLTVNVTTTIKAKTFDSEYFDSAIVSATLTRHWSKVATPIIDAVEHFSGTKTSVSLSCETEGAVIRYTTDGSEPNSHSPRYTGMFEVTATTVIKAIALKTDCENSNVAILTITKEWGIGDALNDPDRNFVTDSGTGWMRDTIVSHDGSESMKSGAIANSKTTGIYSISSLSTMVNGKGVVRFVWKASCEEDEEFEWDHGEFQVDGVTVVRINGETEWETLSYEITTDGDHILSWVYSKDDFGSEGDDCIWVDEFNWTQTSPASLLSLTVKGAEIVVDGCEKTYSCVACYDDGTSVQVVPVWTIVSGGDCATINSEGILMAKRVGNIVVVATYTDAGVTKTATLPVAIVKGLSHVEITGPISVYAGDSAMYSCLARYTDGSVEAVNADWTLMSGSGCATLNPAGMLTALNADGTAMIKASFTYEGETKTATYSVGVSRQILVNADVTGGSAVFVPVSWVNQYPTFRTLYGNDLVAAMAMLTGKKDGSGKQLTVWHDYVAGTDPTDMNDVFQAIIEIEDGLPKVGWRPNLNENGEVRTYKVYGRRSLSNGDIWEYPANSAEHRLFKVNVSMPGANDGGSDAPGVIEAWRFIAMPTAVNGLVYDGTVKQGVLPCAGYTLSGAMATGAGNYIATVVLEDGYKWSNGETGELQIPWQIGKAENVWKDEPSVSRVEFFEGSSVSISLGTPTFGEVKATYTESDLTKLPEGSYEFVFSVNETPNYNGLEKKVNLIIKRSPALEVGLLHRWSFNGNLEDSVGGVVAVAPESVGLSNGVATVSHETYVDLGKGLIPVNEKPFTLEVWATQMGEKKKMSGFLFFQKMHLM